MDDKVRLPGSPSVVIIGAGIVGCSAAYHLAKLGWRDILVLDKGALFENDGSTSHAPGGVVALSHSKLLTRMAIYSSDLYRSLAPFSAERNTYNPVGGLEVAISQARWEDLIRLHGEAKAYGVESHLLTPQESVEKLPLLNRQALVGSLFVPKGAIVAGAHVSAALARDAEAMGGVNFVGHTAVTDFEVKHGRVTAVLTDNPAMPRLDCEQVLLCTNIWSPAMSEKIGVSLPLMAFEHQYVISTPLAELAHVERDNKAHEIVFPTMRDLDSTMYYRQHWDCYGVGSYWHKPLMVHPRDLKKTAKKPFTPEDFTAAWQQAQTMIPALRQAELETKFNGIFAFSIDGYPIMGQSPVKGLWAAVASWLTHAGGVGKSMAEWMTHGETEWDMRQTTIDRFLPYQTTQSYLDIVCAKNYREVYDIIHPMQQLENPRNVRLSPFHPRLQAQEGVFFESAGWERGQWFEANARLLGLSVTLSGTGEGSVHTRAPSSCEVPAAPSSSLRTASKPDSAGSASGSSAVSASAPAVSAASPGASATISSAASAARSASSVTMPITAGTSATGEPADSGASSDCSIHTRTPATSTRTPTAAAITPLREPEVPSTAGAVATASLSPPAAIRSPSAESGSTTR